MPWKVTVTAWLCQPFLSGGRAAGLNCGAVSSYFSGRFAGAVFPARSRQIPVTVVALVSGPAYVASGSQDSRPEVVSLPSKSTERSWLYQPFESAARDGVAVVPGAVLSTWNVFETVVVAAVALRRAGERVPIVSRCNVTALHPVVERMIDSGSSPTS